MLIGVFCYRYKRVIKADSEVNKLVGPGWHFLSGSRTARGLERVNLELNWQIIVSGEFVMSVNMGKEASLDGLGNIFIHNLNYNILLGWLEHICLVVYIIHMDLMIQLLSGHTFGMTQNPAITWTDL